MGNTRYIQNFIRKKHEGMIPLVSRRRENKDNIKMDLNGRDCKYVTGKGTGMGTAEGFVNTVNEISGAIHARNFWTSSTTTPF